MKETNMNAMDLYQALQIARDGVAHQILKETNAAKRESLQFEIKRLNEFIDNIYQECYQDYYGEGEAKKVYIG